MATAVSDDIGVEDKEGTFKEFCNPMYTKNVTAIPIATEIAIFLSIIIYCLRAHIIIWGPYLYRVVMLHIL